MKVLLRLALFALVVAAVVIGWRKYRAVPDAPPTAEAPPPVAPAPDFSPRTWTSHDGRTFEGALVSAKNGHVILRRATDSSYFQLSATALSAEDQAFVDEQSRRAATSDTGFPETAPGFHVLSRKLDIKGNLTRVPASELAGGWQINRTEPTCWFLLSDRLHEPAAGSLWVRVDEKTHKTHSEGALLNRSHLAAFTESEDTFTESMPWPNPGVTLIEAQYGPHAAGNNVTHKLMLLVSKKGLPVDLTPELFDLPPHIPAKWELSIAWRTATGEVRRTIRDGAAITWP